MTNERAIRVMELLEMGADAPDDVGEASRLAIAALRAPHEVPHSSVYAHTHTLALLEVSPRTYREIRSRLEAAGWTHALDSDGVDMTGCKLVEADRVERSGEPGGS